MNDPSPRLIPGRASDMGVPVTHGLRLITTGTDNRGRVPGYHLWSSPLGVLAVGEEAECECGLRVRRVSGSGKCFRGLNGVWPSPCRMVTT